MKWRMSVAVALLALAAALAIPPNAAPMWRADAKAEFMTGMNLALQCDVRAALPHLRLASQDGLNAKDRTVLECMLARFDSNAPKPAQTGLDEWTSKVLGAYQDYWSRVMLGTVTAKAGERELARALAPLAGLGAKKGLFVEMHTLEPKLEEQLRARGYYALFGMTTPLREFMLWRMQTDQTYMVELPGGRESVRVVMLDDFISLGWEGFATCGRSHIGGWTKPDRLYCVRSSYDLDSETFRVSYLGHEGQHFADNRRFPHLKQPELEYRAKLVEIAYADTTLHELLLAFSGNTSGSQKLPHSYANHRLMTDLSNALMHGNPPPGPWWETIPSATIRATAKRLFEEDTRRLQQRWPQ